jgi:hypothetical protein
LHEVPWTLHKLMAKCKKSDKADKDGVPYWNLETFEVE